MFRDPRQAFWYLIGGLFLLSAGLMAISGATIPHALPIMLVLAGGIIIVASLLGARPTVPAFAVFLIGIVVFGLVASGPFEFTPYTTTETYELATAQAPAVEEVDFTCTVTTGNIFISFTSNQSQIYKIVFTKHYSLLYQPTVSFTPSINVEELTMNATGSAVSADITLNQNLKTKLHLKTSTGTIDVIVPKAATKVEKLILTTTTGKVQVNLANTENLQELAATTTTGEVDATIKSSLQVRDATVQLKTTTGRVKLNLNITYIESSIIALTTTGNVNADNVVGFTILPPTTSTSFHAQTPDYTASIFRKLDITVAVTTGNIDITAQHS
jgi:DUF4097 and DUF4098 domain-containing protein YvlB